MTNKTTAKLLITLAHNTGYWATYGDVSAVTSYSTAIQIGNLAEEMWMEGKPNRLNTANADGAWREGTKLTAAQMAAFDKSTNENYGASYQFEEKLSRLELDILLNGKSVDFVAATQLRIRLYKKLEWLMRAAEVGTIPADEAYTSLVGVRSVIARIS